jgi:hypothetical protein
MGRLAARIPRQNLLNLCSVQPREVAVLFPGESKRQREPWARAEDHAHMLDSLQKAGWRE